MPYGTLDRRDAELVILRVGWNCRCRYEWGQHVGLGMRAGLTAAEIARVARGPEAPGWSSRQVAVLEATDDLHQRNVISERSWQRLAEHYRPAQLIEVSMLAGHYAMLAGLLTSVGLALDSEAERILETTPIHGDA
jgi:alkylhydroperoxidase family enzyme